MTDDSGSNPSSRCSLTRFLTASGRKSTQKQTSSFQEFKEEGLITKQNEKPNMSLDLRHPQLVHLYSSANETVAHNELNGLVNNAAPGPSSAASSPSGMISRPQTARRGGHFRGVDVRGRPRSEIVSDDRDSMRDGMANYGSIRSHSSPRSVGHRDPNRSSAESCTASSMYSDLGVNPRSTHNIVSNQVSCSTGHTDVIDMTAFAQSDQNFPNLSMSMPDDADLDVSDKPSTIIHLKMVAPSSGREESEAFVTAAQSMNCGKAETGSNTPSGIQEGNLDGGRIDCLSKDSMSFVNPDPMPGQNIDGRGAKRKLADLSDCDSSSTSDDDLPLIVHCKRSRKIASEEGSSKDGRLVHEVKRTYERAITAQHGSGSAVGRADNPQKASEKRGIVYEKSRGGVPAVAESGRLGLEMSEEPWKRSARPRQSDGSSPSQKQLEEYERNSYAMRSVTDGGKTASGRKVRAPGKSPSDGESQRNSKRPVGQTKKGLPPVVPTKKARLLRCLRPGPVSMKRRRMKEFGVNPKMMSQVLKELTERRIRVGWTSKSFLCNSHQNYYDGYVVFRLTESLPAKEKVTVRVPVESRDDLDPVGSESIVLWRMSDGEVDELQTQVKQEMEHKRTEHIMPVVLQMSYDQIETAYEQVKKDMKTYEITEKDSDVEEEDDEEERDKDDEAEDEDGEERGRGDRRAEEGVDKVEELENDTDENLHVRSYEIIVHDESSKTISCETVKYLEWRKKHPSLDNCESEALRKEVENPRLFETGVENDPPFESPNAAKLVDPIVERTNYSLSRPKRHAVDYSPDAFAPIRLMEGKRLGGKKAAPAKPSTRKKTVSDVCQGKPSLTSSRDTSEGGDVNCGRKGDEKNHKNGSSGEVRKSKGSSAKRRSHRRQELPKSPQRELATTSCDITTGKNTLSTASPDCEPLARDDNHNADVESDDEIPVILDVSDMPLSPAASSPPVVPEQIPVLCERNNCLEKQPPSAYDVVRNEYIRLRDLTRTGAADNTVISSDAPVSAAGDNGEDCDVEMSGLDGKLARETIEHVPLLSGECFMDEQNRSRENSDLSHEASAPTQNAANGKCMVNMPSLQRLGRGDVLGTAAAEELMAPPDLGLPIECVNSQQHPASPVLPPVLQVEASEMNDSGDSVTDGRCSFPLLTSSESVGGGGDTVALHEPIAGDVR